jgi:hypothetical protein
MREKTSFDAEAAAKSAAMQKMVFFFTPRQQRNVRLSRNVLGDHKNGS